MQRTLLTLLLTLTAVPAVDRELGRLPTGELYIKDEVDFCLKAAPARAWTRANTASTAALSPGVDASRRLALHPDIVSIVGNHLSARNWLEGRPLPAAVQQAGDAVPEIARSVTAMLASGADAATVVEDLRRHPDVEWASLNLLQPVNFIPNDRQWTNQWGPSRINATNAWDLAQASTALRVAIIDSGVDLTHPDLAPRIVYNRGFGGNASGDAMRDARGGSSIDHGTHVAGIVAALRNNNLGIAGVADVGIMAMGCAVWDGTNQYNIGSAAAAINDAVANGAAVINCSFGQRAPLADSVRSALDNAQNSGVLVVCAAGNDGTNILGSPSAGWAAHGWPIIVSNIQQDDTPNASSNTGNEVSLAAPGTGILSTFTTNYMTPSVFGTYGGMTGTSQASPHVAGGAAMVRSMNPDRIDAVGTRDLLYRMAQDLGAAGKDPVYGFGMLQLPAAFLGVLKGGTTFAGSNNGLWIPDGTYEAPYAAIPNALAVTPPGGTLVLNGGVGGATLPYYPPQTINQAVTLVAFPDRPVTIGD